jgi:hypothetical protein
MRCPIAHAPSPSTPWTGILVGALLAALALPASAAPAAKTTSKKTVHSVRSAPPARSAPSGYPVDEAGFPVYTTPPVLPGDTLVARIGDRNITLNSFRQEWFNLDANQRPTVPDQLIAYREFLGDLVTRELLGVEASRHPKPLTAQQKADLDSVWHTQARNQLFIEEVENRVTVDTTQIARYRKQLSRILYLTAYVMPSHDAAQAWYTRIVSGTPVSRLDAAAKEGGPDAPQVIDLGHKIREDFDEKTADILFDLAPGRMSPPVPSANGWALIQLTGTHARPNQYAQGNDAAVLHEMRRIKINSYKEVYRDSLAHALHIVYHEAAMDTLLNRFLQLPVRTAPTEGGAMKYNMFQGMPSFSIQDNELVLATTDQGRVTGADFYRFLLGLGDIARPEIRSRDEMRPWVDRVAFDAALLRRALDMGYDKKPRVLREVAKAREYDLVSNLYADSVSSTVHLTDKEVRAFYDADTSRWRLDETATMWVCCVPSKAQADSVMEVGKKGGNLKEMAYKLTMLDNFAENGGMTQPFTRSTCPVAVVADSVFGTPVGSYGGPIPSPEGWNIFKVLTRTPARQRSFEEVKKDAETTLRYSREEDTMQLFLVRLSKRIPVEKHEEALAHLAGVTSLKAVKS